MHVYFWMSSVQNSCDWWQETALLKIENHQKNDSKVSEPHVVQVEPVLDENAKFRCHRLNVEQMLKNVRGCNSQARGECNINLHLKRFVCCSDERNSYVKDGLMNAPDAAILSQTVFD